jgi:hypothetical protein
MKIEKMSPRRKARERKLWRNICIASLVPVVASLLFFGCVAFFVSVLFSLFAYMVYESLSPADDYGYTPWWFFGL